jgi:hypothetical protein
MALTGLIKAKDLFMTKILKGFMVLALLAIYAVPSFAGNGPSGMKNDSASSHSSSESSSKSSSESSDSEGNTSGEEGSISVSLPNCDKVSKGACYKDSNVANDSKSESESESDSDDYMDTIVRQMNTSF